MHKRNLTNIQQCILGNRVQFKMKTKLPRWTPCCSLHVTLPGFYSCVCIASKSACHDGYRCCLALDFTQIPFTLIMQIETCVWAIALSFRLDVARLNLATWSPLSQSELAYCPRHLWILYQHPVYYFTNSCYCNCLTLPGPPQIVTLSAGRALPQWKVSGAVCALGV